MNWFGSWSGANSIRRTARGFATEPGEPILDVKDLDTKSGIRGASLTLRAGEIVGLAGLVGAGRTELARAIFGADPTMQGELSG